MSDIDVALGVIDARIAETHRLGMAETDGGIGWDLGVENASLREVRAAIVAALPPDPGRATSPRP